jgi:PAS domain S-box-containing protein
MGNGGGSGPSDLADVLRRRRQDVIELWRQRVLSDPAVPEANRLSTPALINHVPDLIDRVVQVLERGGDADVRREEIGRAAGRAGEAHAHADNRLASHYAVPSALRELSHLRAAVLELCVRENATIASEQWLLFNADLDEVMLLAAVRLHDAAQADLRASERRLQEALAREETLRRAAEQNELQLRRLSDMGMLGVIVGTRDGELIEANDAFLKMVGYEREDLLSGRMRWRDMTPPEYRHLDERAIAQMQNGGVAVPFEKAYRRRDCGLVHVLIGTASLDAARGTDVAFVLDITS